jgi:creatinine amidohydrolase
VSEVERMRALAKGARSSSAHRAEPSEQSDTVSEVERMRASRRSPASSGGRIAAADLTAALRNGTIPLLPFGAYEQHGPHLPLATDTIMARTLAERLAPEVDGIVLPAVEYGQTTGNDGFPGTLSLSFETVRAITVEIAGGLQRAGAQCMVIINGDFGNQAPLRLAARDILQATDFPVLVVNYPGLEAASGEICDTPGAGFGLHHADEFETSIVLAADPDAVDLTRAVAEFPEFPADFPSVEYGMRELSASGVFGDPRPATAEKGQRLLDRLTAEAAALIGTFVTSRGIPGSSIRD